MERRAGRPASRPPARDIFRYVNKYKVDRRARFWDIKGSGKLPVHNWHGEAIDRGAARSDDRTPVQSFAMPGSSAASAASTERVLARSRVHARQRRHISIQLSLWGRGGLGHQPRCVHEI